jgi:hypothetical protein
VIRYPYHRYLRYQVLNGDDVEEIRGHMADLQYAPPQVEDVETLRRQMMRRLVDKDVRRRHEVLFLEEPCESLDLMFWMVETAPVRACAERMLLDRLPVEHVATVLGLKFNQRLTVKSIELFRDGFWDTATLTPLDFSEYFRLAGVKKPDPPPSRVALRHRPLYSAWDQGLPPDPEELPVEEMVRQVSVDSFMQFKRLQSSQAADAQKQAIAYAQLLLKTAPATKALRAASGGRGELPPLQALIEYPEDSVRSLADLHREYSDAVTGTGADIDAMGLGGSDDDE